jgi:solute carrier family 35 protein E1
MRFLCVSLAVLGGLAADVTTVPAGPCRSRSQCLGSGSSLRRQQQQPFLQRQRPAAASNPAVSSALQLHGGASSAVAEPTLMESLKIPLAFAGWYLMSIIYSVLNKEVLNVWKFPVAWSAVQLLVGSLFVGLLWCPLPRFGSRDDGKAFAPLREPPKLSCQEIGAISGVAVWLALGHVMSTVSPAYGTVAFTNVVKTLEPLFTCLFSAIFFNQVFSVPVYLSLVPVIFGVALASANEVSFSMISLVSGLLSNVCFALRAISAKKAMNKPVGENMNAQNLYAVLTMVALVVILPLVALAEGSSLVAGTQATIASIGLPRFAKMVVFTGLAHYIYNECAFLALSSVHPVTHAVANTIKRVAVIVLSVLYFRNPLTLTGAVGSAVAIFGVMLYSLAKAQEDAPKKSLQAAAGTYHRPRHALKALKEV